MTTEIKPDEQGEELAYATLESYTDKLSDEQIARSQALYLARQVLLETSDHQGVAFIGPASTEKMSKRFSSGDLIDVAQWIVGDEEPGKFDASFWGGEPQVSDRLIKPGDCWRLTFDDGSSALYIFDGKEFVSPEASEDAPFHWDETRYLPSAPSIASRELVGRRSQLAPAGGES
jgi:hypothetical protein